MGKSDAENVTDKNVTGEPKRNGGNVTFCATVLRP
jgi:hypothetical protein